MSDALKIGVIGGKGWLGVAIVQAVLDARLASLEELTLSYRSERPARFQGARWTTDNQELADRSDLIIVSVRPAEWPSVAVSAPGKLVVSVMAGIPLSRLAGQLRTERVARALPNAAAEVGKSYTPWVASPAASEGDRSIVRRIFEACGSTDEVTSEADIDYLAALSGSGPAFPSLLANAMMQDALEIRALPGNRPSCCRGRPDRNRTPARTPWGMSRGDGRNISTLSGHHCGSHRSNAGCRV